MRDDDHIIALFKQNGCWGAVAKSNFTTVQFREPVYRTIRALVMSFFDVYFNTAGEKSMRSYTRPVDLRRFDGLGWRTSEEDLDATIGEYLVALPSHPQRRDGEFASAGGETVVRSGNARGQPRGSSTPARSSPEPSGSSGVRGEDGRGRR